MGVPPKKMSNFFPEIFCQRIDRKSQEFSGTYVKPLGRDRRRKKKIQVNKFRWKSWNTEKNYASYL